MSQMWNVLDRLPVAGHARIRRTTAGVVDVDIQAADLSPAELQRIAQHLLEAAGYRTVDVMQALTGLPPVPADGSAS